MATIQQDIRRWFERGQEQDATHMIIMCDTFSHEDYPVYVTSLQNVKEEVKNRKGKNMQQLMEVYDLSMDIESQLAEHRAFHY